MLTPDDVLKALPANLKSMATQAFTDRINNIVADPLIAEQVRGNFISYTNVLKDGRYKVDDYLNAVTYVSFKLMGLSNQDAYFRTFPARHQSLLAKGTSPKDISTYVSAYNKGKLVNTILEQCMVPSWVLNQDAFQKAINTQMELMLTANSEKVRSDAANSILTHLKPPEARNINLKIGLEESSGLTELKTAMTQLAQQQREAIANGTETRLIAGQPIYEAEFVEVDAGQTKP